MDFVYIVKEDENNEDLKYSLRSIAKYYPENKVWIVGYKPSWVKNVEYLPVKQSKDKWKNSMTNILTACKCKDISDDFILMNDDFFMIKPLIPIEMIANTTLGLLSSTINKNKELKSPWYDAFQQVYDLLKDLNIPEPYYDFEAHLPLQINKKKFIKVINLPKVQEFMKTSKVLHKRTLYKNFDKPEKMIKIPADVKIERRYDDANRRVNICGWLSVYDRQVGNAKFGLLNRELYFNLNQPCIYEKEITEEERKNLKNVEINPNNVKIPTTYQENFKKKKDSFIHF